MNPDDAAQLIELGRKTPRSVEDDTALRACLGRLAPHIERIVASELRGRGADLARVRSTIEDAQQEVLLRMVDRPLPSNVEGRLPERVVASWVRTVTTRLFIDASRRKANTHEVAEPAQSGSSFAETARSGATTDHDPVERRELRQAISDCAERLSDLRARLFQLMAVDPDISTEDIAVQLGYVADPAALDDVVRGRVFVLRAAMRRDLADCLRDRESGRRVVRSRALRRVVSDSKGGEP